jgi:hypothetical protein
MNLKYKSPIFTMTMERNYANIDILYSCIAYTLYFFQEAK